MRKRLLEDGVALTERLCVYAQYIDADWVAQGVLDVIKTKLLVVHPAPRARAAPTRRCRSAATSSRRAVAKGRDGVELTPEELTALFAETRPEAIEDIRQAADELRAELAGDTVTFVVNRNINVSNVCIVGCAFCGFGQGKRSPDAYEHEDADFVARIDEAVEYGATELCIQSGIHPDWASRTTWATCALAKDDAPAAAPARVLADGDRAHLRRQRPAPSEVFAQLRDAGLGSTPGTAAEVLHDGVRERISPNKLPVARWVEVIEASHRAGLRSTATVMFGHIEEPWELAEHMRVVRALQERTGGFTEFVPLLFIPFHTLLGPDARGRGDLSRGEPQAHGGVPPRAGQDRPVAAGVLGEDGPGGRDRGAALGRQRPRRHADGGVHQPPGRPLPRHEPGPARAHRRGPRRRPPGARSARALRLLRAHRLELAA